jgi:hypothetical protein
MTPHTLIASVLVLLAGGTGLLWPKSNSEAQYFDAPRPAPVRTLTYRLEPHPLWLPRWLGTDASAPAPAWRLRGDGVWEPWVLNPPAWLTAIPGSYVAAETVPLPPERPKGETPPSTDRGVVPTQKRIARDGGLCEKHGLKQVWTDKFRWRCRP